MKLRQCHCFTTLMLSFTITLCLSFTLTGTATARNADVDSAATTVAKQPIVVSLRPPTKGERTTRTVGSIATDLNGLTGSQINLASLRDAPRYSLPGKLHVYRATALIEVDKRMALAMATRLVEAVETAKNLSEQDLLRAQEAFKLVDKISPGQPAPNTPKTRQVITTREDQKHLSFARAAVIVADKALAEAKSVEADALAEVLEAEEQKRLAFDDLPGSDTLSDAAIAELNVLLGVDPTVSSDTYNFGDAMRPSQ